MNKRITAFSWGYWGWGTHIDNFLAVAEAHEAAAGYAPPAFADVRIKRSGRAKVFVDNAFEKIVGKDRYRWFPGLSNEDVAKHKRGITIAKPEDAYLLLEYVQSQAKANRRVLFFCACEHIEVEGEVACHRRIVADLLLDAAKQKKQKLEVVEWPGGEQAEVRLIFDSVPEFGVNLPLDEEQPEDEVATLPVGSILAAFEGKYLRALIATGPAKYMKGKWWLPAYDWPPNADDKSLEEFYERAEALQTYYGTRPRKV